MSGYPAPFLDEVDLNAESYNCKCGEIHRGPYALYAYARCNCPHEYGFVSDRFDEGYEHCVVCYLTRNSSSR